MSDLLDELDCAAALSLTEVSSSRNYVRGNAFVAIAS
jgi:hypothetical protein